MTTGFRLLTGIAAVLVAGVALVRNSTEAKDEPNKDRPPAAPREVVIAPANLLVTRFEFAGPEPLVLGFILNGIVHSVTAGIDRQKCAPLRFPE